MPSAYFLTDYANGECLKSLGLVDRGRWGKAELQQAFKARELGNSRAILLIC
jgi:hypothetical protein